MVVSVTASTTAGLLLSGTPWPSYCTPATPAGEDAPHLSAIRGTDVAARLVGIACGLTALPKMPAGNVQVRASYSCCCVVVDLLRTAASFKL